MAQKKIVQTRIQWLDALRTIAIISMIAWHTMFIFWWFHQNTFNISHPLLSVWQKSTLILFLITHGIAFSISQKKMYAPIIQDILAHYSTRKMYMRLLQTRIPTSTKYVDQKMIRAKQLLIAAAIISIGSIIFIPIAPVYFGVLHLLCTSTLLLIVIRNPLHIAFLSVLCLLAQVWLPIVAGNSIWLLPFGIMPRTFYSIDYVPLVPWFAYVGIGRIMGMLLLLRIQKIPHYNSLLHIVTMPGRYSLLIYMVHIPIIASIAYLLNAL